MKTALNRPIRVGHAILAVVPIAAIALAGQAIAGSSDSQIDRTALSAGGPAFTQGDYHFVGQVANNAAGTQSTIVQQCPRGTIPIGGGGGGISETPGEQQVVYSNVADGPDRNNKPDSWLVAVDNLSSTDLSASVEVICVER
jgi:hypothetical protein